MSYLKKAMKITKQDGFVELARRSVLFPYKLTPFYSHPAYQVRKIEQTENRWRMIKPNLSDSDGSVLDIGCNAGFLTAKAADHGLTAIGVDRYTDEFQRAKDHAYDLSRNKSGIGIIDLMVTPENVDQLPECDVVFLLSVYHYWYREYGPKKANEMLRSLDGFEKLFFESTSLQRRYTRPDSDVTPPGFDDSNEESIIDFHQKLLEEEFSGANVKCLGKNPYNDEDRYLFFVESR